MYWLIVSRCQLCIWLLAIAILIAKGYSPEVIRVHEVIVANFTPSMDRFALTLFTKVK